MMILGALTLLAFASVVSAIVFLFRDRYEFRFEDREPVDRQTTADVITHEEFARRRWLWLRAKRIQRQRVAEINPAPWNSGGDIA